VVAQFPSRLDFEPGNFHLQHNNRIRAPLTRTLIMSANLVMSDHLSRAWRDGTADGAHHSDFPDQAILSSGQ
jgi:hypothetical protein